MRLTLSLLLLLPLAACSGSDQSSPDTAAEVAAAPAAVTATETADPDTPEATGLRWRIRNHEHADLDDDGTLEDIGYGMSGGPIRITTVLSSTGARITLQGGYGGIDWWPSGYPDLNGDGQREIVLSREVGDQRPVVVRLVDSERFEIVRRRDQQPLVYGPTAAQDGFAHVNDWYVRKGELYSYRSLEAYPLGSHSFDLPDTYAVRRWRWTLDGDRLRAADEGYWCRGPGSEYPALCRSDLPALMPAAEDRLPRNRFPGELPPSECGPYAVSPVRIPGGANGEDAWLVFGPGCAESAAYEVYVRDGSAWVGATHPVLPFLGEGIWDGRRGLEKLDAWVTPEGRLFSSRGPLGGARQRLWEWTLDGTVLSPTELGMVCFEPAVDPERFGSC